MPEPIPVDAPYGVAAWQDYVNNWRDDDANWLQSRAIVRFATNAKRDAAYPSPPGAGQFIFNAQTAPGNLEMSTGTAWAPYRPMPANLVKTSDDGTQVAISHSGAAGKGFVFTPTYVGTNADLRVQGGVLTVTATDVNIKTGAKTAKLTTDATNLISDTPITAPSLALTGAGTVFSAPGKTVAVGTLTADSATITNLTVSGTLSGGVLNGPSGTIGGVQLSGSYAYAAGLVASSGLFYGGTTAAYMRYRNPSDASLGAAYIAVVKSGATEYTMMSSPGLIYMDGDQAWRTGSTVYWYNAAGALKAYGGLIVYATTDPGAANYPPGTLWIS